MSAHKDIRILFTVGDRRYEAVGFLNEDEDFVYGNEVIRRTADVNGGAIGNEDDAFISAHLDELPEELRRYRFTTNQIGPSGPRRIRYFDRDCDRWFPYWGNIDYQWRDHDLVVRRCK